MFFFLFFFFFFKRFFLEVTLTTKISLVVSSLLFLFEKDARPS